jgi:hypothetical protein
MKLVAFIAATFRLGLASASAAETIIEDSREDGLLRLRYSDPDWKEQ